MNKRFYCSAKWQELFLFLNSGMTNSCHHPLPHKIPLDELETIGLGKKRSKKFRQLLLKALSEKVPPNSVKPGDKCTKNMHVQCKGDSACYTRSDGMHPICLAGIDGTNPVGILPSINNYGNYDNGMEQYFPLNKLGCAYSAIKCPPRFKCNPNYNACIEMERIKVDTSSKIYKSNRIEFQPPLPLKKKYVCPNNHNLFENKDTYFCKHNRTDKICALEPNKRDNNPFCSTVICPDNYFQLEPGICENEEGKTCSLEPNNKGDPCRVI